MKRCARCGESSDNFSPDRRNKDGLQGRCRPCSTLSSKEGRLARLPQAKEREARYYQANKAAILASNARSRAKNRDKVLAGKRAYYERIKKTPEYLDKTAAYMKATKDKKREYDKHYRASRPEICAAKSRKWIAANPGKRKAIIRQYKAKRRSQEDLGVSGGILAAWTKSQPKACFYCGCGCEDSFHVDHFMPLAKGGAHVLTNLRIACAPCNQRKGAKLPDVWIAELERVAA